MVESDREDRCVALRVVTRPPDTNHYGTVFGGVIMSLIDQAGFVEARNHGQHRWVTAAIDRVEFKQAVHVGDIVSLFTTTVREGTTSVTVGVEVEAQRTDGERVPVTSATLTMVAVDAQGKPIAFRSAPSV
jgi:acyl-CoA thioesterase YciA